MIKNRNNKKSVAEGGSTLPSTMTLHEFADGMKQLDLSDVPEDKRPWAIKAHMLKMMGHHLVDRELGERISVSHFNHLVEHYNQRNRLILP